MPSTAPLWTPVAYAAFDVALNKDDEKNKKDKKVCVIFYLRPLDITLTLKLYRCIYFLVMIFLLQKPPKEEELKAVKEVEVKQSDNDAKNETGCIVS